MIPPDPGPLPAPSPEDRAVLVTGGARRLGRQIALGLARGGWDVVVHCHRSLDDAERTAAEVRALGRRAEVVAADLAAPDGAQRLFEAAASRLRLRAVVNNASLFEHDTPATFTAQRLQAHMAPNLAAPIELTRRLHEFLHADERGVVVNLLDHKLESLNPDFFSYTLTKQALLTATKAMAMAFAPRLRVVGVSPGLTLPSYLQSDEAFAHAHAGTALLDHSSRPQDIVDAVVFLASAPAVTGINLVVDGGQHLLGLRRDVSFLEPADLARPGRGPDA